MEWPLTDLFIALLCFILIKNYSVNAEEHQYESHSYVDHDHQNESFEFVQSEGPVTDPTYPNLMEAILQLWWAQRTFIHNARHEKDELRRLKLVFIEKLDDLFDGIEAAIEDQISSLALWDKPESEHLNPLNHTAIGEMVRKWKDVEVFFSNFVIDNAEDICSRMRNEFRAAQEDLPRRLALIERMMIEIEEQRKL